jgi:putative oxygen-independent coproporphyrinogen III oxidase
MPIFTEALPLSLYIHLPWCVKKCPYCDFNSHALKENLPEAIYVAALLNELDQYLIYTHQRPLTSIFFGGGTPSLFSAKSIQQILDGTAQRINFHPNIEITLEANPGTVEQSRFNEFRQAGINRLSLGVQSLQNDKLKLLGRIHDEQQANRAIIAAKQAGFKEINIDLMYGLPTQSIEDALFDLRTAIAHQPNHLSWYQLTIEPNTFFHHHPPALPDDEIKWEMQLEGQSILSNFGYEQYEVSAYAVSQQYCRHNLNYWQFGDYLGIGAGAHGKMTDSVENRVMRFAQVKHPKEYLDMNKRKITPDKILTEKDLAFEFMLNALRLSEGVSTDLFQARTGLTMSYIETPIKRAKQLGLLLDNENSKNLICPTMKGKQFLNDLVALFL